MVFLRTGLGLIALAMLVVVLGNVVLSGEFTLAAGSALLALIAVLLSYVLHEFVADKERTALLERHSAQLRSVRSHLQQSLTTAAAMNARLNEREALYKGLVEAQGDAILRRTVDGRLTYGNEAFFTLFGLKSGSAVGQTFLPQLHSDNGPQSFTNHASLESGKAWVRHDQHVRTAFGWRWIAWEDTAIRDTSGKLVEVQSVGRDISDRKALEASLSAACDRAEAASRAKSNFLATMSHEIRTPMNGVLGMARLLLETHLRAEQRTYVKAISESGEALLALIGDILDFSKIESGTLALEDDDVAVRKVIEGVVELASPRAHEKNLELVAVLDPEVPPVIRTDGVRLRQILTNLVGNAVKFTEKGGVHIHVRLVDDGEQRRVRFDVRDTGVGVPAGKRSEIFNEFVQADSTHARRFGGTGLGLAISRRLVEAMGGNIGIEALSSGGSQFWFTLPSTILIPTVEPETQPLSGVYVAVVARNRVLRAGLMEQLRAAGAIIVPKAGKNPLRPDVVLVDAGTGSDPKPLATPDASVPSVVLVTPGARAGVHQLLEKGFAGYLVKPVRHASLVAQIAPHPDLLPIVRRNEPPPPATTVAPQHSLAVLAERSGQEADADARPGLRFLLAEDNAINALLTRELLRRRGHEVVDVKSGEAAVKALEAGRFDIVLTDIHMPGMDGVEAARAIRANETASGRKRVPIIALTADALEAGMRACKDAGMDGFLTKPIDPAQLDEMLVILFPHAKLMRIAAA